MDSRGRCGGSLGDPCELSHGRYPVTPAKAHAPDKPMPPNQPLMVNCGPHGERIAAVVCRHLLGSEDAPAGFIVNSSDPLDLQAWCYRCEDMFDQEGGMTEAFRAFNGMAVVCVMCFHEAKYRHGIPAT